MPVTGQEVLSLKGHTDVVASVSFSPDGKRIVSAGHDETVKVWERPDGPGIAHAQGPRGTGSRRGHQLGRQKDRLVQCRHDAEALGRGNGPGGNGLSRDTRVAIWSVCISPDGKRIVSGASDNTVKCGMPGLARNCTPSRAYGAGFERGHQRDGKRIVSGSEDGTMKVRDEQSDWNARTFWGQKGWVMSVCISPDGKRVCLGNQRGVVKVWDAETRRELLSLQATKFEVIPCASAPEAVGSLGRLGRHAEGVGCETGGELLALAGQPRSDQERVHQHRRQANRLREHGHDGEGLGLPHGRELFTLRGHQEQVTSVCISSDGKRIVSEARTKR